LERGGLAAVTVAQSTGDQSSDAHRVIGRRVMPQAVGYPQIYITL
jgi:hypothetical protein